jgi:hypothetical protein
MTHNEPVRPPAGVAGQGAENGDPRQIDRVMTDLFWDGAFGWQNRGASALEFRRLKAARERAVRAERLLAIDDERLRAIGSAHPRAIGPAPGGGR